VPNPGPFEQAFTPPSQRDAVPIGQLGNMPQDRAKYDEYIRLMQALTAPKREAGPDARRAEALMPTGPQPASDSVQLQEQNPIEKLMAFLTKPRVTIGMAGTK
jgi:hypothetical protein